MIHIHPDRATNLRLIERNRSANDVWNRLSRDRNQKIKIEYVTKNLNDDNINNIEIKDRAIDKYFSIELKQKDGTKRNLMDIGFGYSQLLPVLISCLGVLNGRDRTSKNGEKIHGYTPSLIIIEEPEVHTHPRLASVIAEFFKKFSSDFDKCLFLIETHSEHLILKTQGLIKESPEYSKDNQILFIEKTIDDKNNSNSTIQSISFDEKGYMSDDFPDDFFDISYKLYSQLTS